MAGSQRPGRLTGRRQAPGFAAALGAALALALAAATGAGSPRARSPFRNAASVRAGDGYWLVAADGGAFGFGACGLFGPNRNEGPDIVGAASTADGLGYWMVDDDGTVFAYGDAANFGSRSQLPNNLVGFAARPQGDGYWLAASDGGVFSFGRAGFHGSTGDVRLNQPIVGIAATPSGQGYWLVASDGGIFAFGDAAFYGSTGANDLNQPIVGIAATPTGQGYWLVASDGGIFAFGDARFHGSTGAIALNQPIVGMAVAATGSGYWLAARDGGIFAFGDATFLGSAGSGALNQPIRGIIGPPPPMPVSSPPPPPPPVDSQPVAVADQAVLPEDTSVTISVLANDSGLDDGGIVSVITAPGHGTAVVTPAGDITYTPASNYFGADSLVYRITDIDGDTAEATVTLTVAPINDAPRITGLTRSTPEDTPVSAQLAASDVDGDPLTFSVTTAPSHATATVDASGVFTYTPASGYAGPDSFGVTVDDGHGGTDSATVDITVTPVNHPPTITPIADQQIPEDTSTGALPFTVGDPDQPTSALMVSATSSNAAVVPPTGITLAGSAANRTITLTPAPNASGLTQITVTVSDGTGGSAPTSFAVTVTPVNDPPTISPVTNVDVAVGAPVPDATFTVGDPDDAASSLTVTATSSDQSLVTDANLAPGGSGANRTLTITPQPAITGTATITLTVTDPAGATATTTFSFTMS